MSLWRKIKAIFVGKRSWQQLEFFDPRWKKRIEAMARFIRPGDSVLDLGCGQMWLKEFLSDDNSYTPCDYSDRGPGTVICDFNRGKFPPQDADVSFVSGCLEYVEDVEWFVGRIAAQSRCCVIAYCITSPDKTLAERRQNAWKNHLSEAELIQLFERHGMTLSERGGQFMSSHIYVFDRSQRD